MIVKFYKYASLLRRKNYSFIGLVASLLITVSCAVNKPELEEVVVTGIRASVQTAEDIARENSELSGELDAHDLAALQRVSAEESRKVSSESSWLPSRESINGQVISVGDNENIYPEAVNVQVRIEGFRARVLVDAYYYNKHDRQLEGTFKFRLPNGAKPYYFAFGETYKSDIRELELRDFSVSQDSFDPLGISRQRESHWKNPKVAVMAEKQKAAYAYTQVVARQVDPALVEWSGAGVFSGSIFPLIPKAMHRVVIGYDIGFSEIQRELMLDIPMPKKGKKRNISVSLSETDRLSTLVSKVVNNKLVKPQSLDKLMGSSLSFSDKALDGIRIFREVPIGFYMTGDDELGGYFAINHTVSLPQIRRDSSENAVFLLDTSLSASTEKFYLWREMILKILSENQDSIKQFAFMSFNAGQYWYGDTWLPNSDLQREQLRMHIDSLLLEGASDLGAALLEAGSNFSMESEDQYDVFLMSDGAITWGDQKIQNITAELKEIFSGRLFSYRLGVVGELVENLSYLSREFEGANFFIPNEAAVDSLSSSHKNSSWKIEDVSLEGASDILIDGRPKSLYPGQRIVIAGRKNGVLSDKIQLTLTSGNEVFDLNIPLTLEGKSELTPRIYGELAVTQLDILDLFENHVAAAYAKHFLVPSSSASLLMLESDQDYKEFNINPEEDKFIVKSTTANAQYKETEKEKRLVKSDKYVLEQLYKKISSFDFLEVRKNNSFTELFKTLPEAEFQLNLNRLGNHRALFKQQVDVEYSDLLEAENIYSLVNSEAKRRFNLGDKVGAVVALSSLVERAPGDVSILRDLSFTLEEYEDFSNAYLLQSRILDMRPFQASTYLSLAKLAEKLRRPVLALFYYELIDAINWEDFEGEIGMISRSHFSVLLKAILSDGSIPALSDYASIRLKEIEQRGIYPLSGVVVEIVWNTDRTDIDLHVVEPSGEECYYQNEVTKQGGYITDDVTSGFGPEMYFNERAPNGRYKVFVKYFSEDQNKLGLKTRVKVSTMRKVNGQKIMKSDHVVTLNEREEKVKVDEILVSRLGRQR